MKLKTYIEDTGTKRPEFAEEIEVTPQSLERYINGKRIPEPDIMERIRIATGDLVTANDFYHPSLVSESTPMLEGGK